MTSATFRKEVFQYYKKNKRDLPWRRTNNPYHILVSEIMLQQTQVDRVVPKYVSFIKRFPSAQTLARARLSSVLKEWQGLGYNRRGLNLKRAAEMVVKEFGGRFPKSVKELIQLPGVGEATANAILVYVFNKPVVYVETNIRSVYIYHFFPRKEKVSDDQLFPYIEKTLDRKNPRRWYSALMDYGTWLKKEHGNTSVRSRHYTKQSKFEGSYRQLRAKILRLVLDSKTITAARVAAAAGTTQVIARKVLLELVRQSLIIQQKKRYSVG